MIKAAFFDIDGTLLSFKTHRIPDTALEALSAARRNGVKLFLATGREPKMMAFINEFFDFDGAVGFNGGYAFDKTGVLHNAPLAPEAVLSAFKYFQERQIASTFEALEETRFNLITDQVRELLAFVGATVPETTADEIFLKQDIYQMSVFLSPQEEKDFISRFPDYRTMRWTDAFANVISRTGGKSTGIAKVCEKYDIARTEIMAFGDGGNDTDMLKFAGIGVAMGNAGDDVKAAADYVTSSVDEDGIYNALKHFEVI